MSGLCKSSDGGQTWQRLRYGIWHSDEWYSEAWDISIHPQGSAVGVFLAMAGGPQPIASSTGIAGIYRSVDGGATWSRSVCGLSNIDVNSILVDPNNSSVLIAGIGGGWPSGTESAGQFQNGGLYRSTDGGGQWSLGVQPADAEKQTYVHLRARGSPTTTFTTFGFDFEDLTHNVGFLRSTDGGASWTAFAPELRTKFINGFDLSADGQTICACRQDQGKVFKSTDGGSSWSEIAAPANGPIRVSPANPNLVIFSWGSSVYRTADGLASQSNVCSTAGQVMDIEFAPSSPNVVYAATKGYSIYRSIDAGATWMLMKNLWTEVLNP